MNSRAFWHVVFVGATGAATYMTTYYYYQLLTQIGLLLVLPIGLFIAGQIAFILWLKKQQNPFLSTIGAIFETTMQYLALFEGLILTVLVFYVLGGGESSGGPNAFYADFVFGSLYLSMFIYGAVGLPTMLTAEGAGPRLIATLYLAIAIGPALWLTMVREDLIRALAVDQLGPLIAATLGYCLIMSVAGMWILMRPSGDRSKPGAS